MMRIVLTAALISIAPLVMARDETIALKPIAEPHVDQQAMKRVTNHFMVRAPIADPGEIIDPGDILTVTRGFGTWSLGCSVRISSGRRSCSIEQLVLDSSRPVGERSSIRWGIGSDATKKSVLFIHVTSNFLAEAGMAISFAGLEKWIPQQAWFCADQGCIARLPFEGIFQSALQPSGDIRFAYKVKVSSQEPVDTNLQGDMSWFEKVLEIAGYNPFAPVAQPKKHAVLPQNAGRKNASAAMPVPAPKNK